MKATSRRLKTVRQAQGLSLRTLAVEAGIHYTTLVRIEAGRCDPKVSTMQKVAKVLKVSVNEIVG